MAVASKGGGVINEHFGHAREFLVYEASPAGVRFIGHRKTDLYCSGGNTCGDGESALDQIIRALAGCEAVLCSKVGYEPWEALEAAGIQPNGEHGMEPIEDAVAAVYREMAATGRAEPGSPARRLPGERTTIVALKINDRCVNCYACVDVCPTGSIVKARKHFVINPTTCTECVGSFDDPQCASICPIECAIPTRTAPQPARLAHRHTAGEDGGGTGHVPGTMSRLPAPGLPRRRSRPGSSQAGTVLFSLPTRKDLSGLQWAATVDRRPGRGVFTNPGFRILGETRR